jgi:DNA invertase Pin-like site-specific DNA recombinase
LLADFTKEERAMKEPKAKRAACYLRVSTSDQREGLQADETQELIERRGWELADTYCDHGISGSKERRPALDRLLADARRRRFDLIVVWKSDRLFRSLKHMVNTLDELAALGVGFISVTEPLLDTTTPQGRLLLHLVSAFAEFEKATLIERTRAGLAAAKRRGARLGRPRADLDVLRARAMRAAGLSLRAIAAELGVKPSTLHRALNLVPKTSSESTRQPPESIGTESTRNRVAQSVDSGTLAGAAE